MNPDFFQQMYKQLKIGEGERLDVYADSKGIPTVGIGHNLRAHPVPGLTQIGQEITREQSFELFKEDLERVVRQVKKKIPWSEELNDPRKAVLYDMAFNMGINGLLSFTSTLPLIRKGEYDKVAVNLFASKYARDVRSDGPGGRFDRVERLITQLKTGKWTFERPR